jgi:hypothetical protein
MDDSLVIRAVARDLIDPLGHLRKQFWQHLVIGGAVVTDLGRHDFAGRFVHADMQLAPRAAFACAMLPHLPFALAIDFHPRAVHHHMHSLMPTSRQTDFDRSLPSTQRRVVRRFQAAVQRVQDRLHQSLCSTQRQVIHLFECQHAFDGRI